MSDDTGSKIPSMIGYQLDTRTRLFIVQILRSLARGDTDYAFEVAFRDFVEGILHHAEHADKFGNLFQIAEDEIKGISEDLEDKLPDKHGFVHELHSTITLSLKALAETAATDPAACGRASRRIQELRQHVRHIDR